MNCTNSLTVADVLRFGSFHAGHVRLDEALWNLGRGDSRRGRQDEALSDRVWVFVRERSDLSSQEGAEASDFLRLGEHHRDRPQQSLGEGKGGRSLHTRASLRQAALTACRWMGMRPASTWSGWRRHGFPGDGYALSAYPQVYPWGSMHVTAKYKVKTKMLGSSKM